MIKTTLGKTRWLLLVTLAALALQSTAQAQDVPNVKASLKKILGSLPVEGIKNEVEGMVGALKKTSCGGGLTGCYATQSGPLQLYFFTSSQAQQTMLLVIDKQMKMPKVLGAKAQKVMGDTSLGSPIIAISTTEFTLDMVKMPPSLQKVVRDNYFNVNSMTFAAGVQLAARANLDGPIAKTMEAFGVKADELTIRAAVVMPIPTDLASGAGTGAGLAGAMSDGDTMKKAGADAAKPEAFVEFQFAPGSRLPMLLPPMTLTDATFFLNNELTFGYQGNASFKGLGDKKVIVKFQTPLTPEGALDFIDFQFYMATPATFTMEDAANVIFAMATPDKRLAKYGGGFIRNVESYKGALLAAATPLSVFQIRNPKLPAEYRFGDSSKPFPGVEHFNFVIAGPTAPDGPMLQAATQTKVLGQDMGSLDAYAGRAGLNATVSKGINIKLGPLGRLNVNMASTVAIDQGKQLVSMTGNLAGQKIAVTLNGSTMTVEVSASCVNPFEIKTSLTIKADTDIAQVFEGQGGANVDPSKIGGCVGKDLEAAYNKIAGEYKNLGGYTASAANAELKKISDAAAATAAAAAQQAQQDYNRAKDAARDTASRTASAATQAFNDAGNAFKRLGKKKKHRKGPDPKFAASVFDWDYYYDNNPDVVRAKVDLATHWRDSGFNEGRQGSPQFNAQFYWSRYLDVQQLCQQADRACSLQHWLDYGLRQGRQGSAGFSVASYLNRYPDLQRAFGAENFEDALDHWFTSGEDEGRNASPAANASGPLAGSRQIGGDGGGAWTDADAGCKNETPRVFNVQSGSRVDGLQFWYPSFGWAPAHGTLGNKYTQVFVDNGDDIVAVGYRSGDAVDTVTFYTRRGKKYGPYGGNGGSPNRYDVTPGEKLGCMTGRAGSSIDQLTFPSTGLR